MNPRRDGSTPGAQHRVPAARIVFSPEDRQAILGLVDEALQSGSLTLGAQTVALEEAFAARHQRAHGIAVSSGTAALEIILRAIGVAGREVIVPTNTFFATAAAVVHAGGVPRFADVSASTLALGLETLEAAVTPETMAVIAVHIGGLISPDIETIARFCAERGLVLIEDAAHAHGSRFDRKAAGSFGHAAAFSFYPTKVITSGEGGMIVTDDDGLRDEAIVYRDQGKAGFLGGDHVRLGYAWRMSELHAAVGLVHLRRLDEFIEARNVIADTYTKGLAQLDGIVPVPVPPSCLSNYYKYVALLDEGIERNRIKERLRTEHGVSLAGEVYAAPLHRQPVFAALAGGSFPVADDICARQVCLPLHSDMTVEEAHYVLESIETVLSA